MKGININCKDRDWCEMILNRTKLFETRNCKSLYPYRNKWVGIVKTGCGKAMLVGYAHINNLVRIVDNESSFRNYYEFHCVEPGSKYDFNGGKKYLYWIDKVKRINPVAVTTKGIVAREVPDMEDK